jgi:hypothetical protein
MEKGFHQFVSMGRTFPHSKREYNDWVEQETICTFPTLILKFKKKSYKSYFPFRQAEWYLFMQSSMKIIYLFPHNLFKILMV